eukprot:TRINITY_DN10528_c0_g1_i7.p1 TRINITY_DN10528_c0_g1~~TRINITY_DN10528_c0_g1_i7.p1  ORF type:complete len:468 (-),score=92.24 TRINITY_DN10528_c0_g1_i7:139-1440(-)
MITRIKIADTFYEIPLPLSLEAFIDTLHKNCSSKLPSFYKLHYKDIDGDLISICNQDDYDIALADLKTPSVYLIASEADAKDNSAIAVPESESLKTVEPLNDSKDDKSTENKDTAKPEAEERKEKCFACYGKRESKRQVCKLCNGTGEVNLAISALKKDVERALRKEVLHKVEEEVKKSEQDQSNPCNSMLSALSQQKVFSKIINCSTCKEEIESGEALFYCLFCRDFCVCRNCEGGESHIHTLLKGKTANEKSNYKAKLIKNFIFNRKVHAQSALSKKWTLKNVGNTSWPEDTKLIRTEGDDLSPNTSSIGSVKSGSSIVITILFFGPKEEKKYRSVFKLKGGEELFGPRLVLEFEVEAEEELEQNDSVVKNTQRATANMELVKRDRRFRKEYEENLMQIFMLGDWNPKKVLGLIIKHKNNINNVTEDLFEN